MRDRTRRIRVGWIGLAAMGLGVGVVALGAGPGDDPEDAEERAAIGRQIVRNQCLVCHGEEIIASQRLTPAQWDAEVKKMMGWGAVVPADQVAPLTAHLAGLYRPDIAPAAVEMATAANFASEDPPRDGTPPTGHPDRGSSLFLSQCANCHGTAAVGGDLGPNLVEKAVLYRPEAWADVLRDGRNAMPGFSSVLKPGEADDLLAWLRGLRWPDDAR